MIASAGTTHFGQAGMRGSRRSRQPSRSRSIIPKSTLPTVRRAIVVAPRLRVHAQYTHPIAPHANAMPPLHTDPADLRMPGKLGYLDDGEGTVERRGAEGRDRAEKGRERTNRSTKKRRRMK